MQNAKFKIQNVKFKMQNWFSVLIPLRGLFLLLARHSVQAPSALASCVGSVSPALQAFLPRGLEKIDKFNFSLAPQRQLSIIICNFAGKIRMIYA